MTNDFPGPVPAARDPQELRRLCVLILGTLAYGGLVASLIYFGVHHFGIYGIAIQAAVLLPSLAYGLKGRGATATNNLTARRVGFGLALALGFFAIESFVSSALNAQGITMSDEAAYRFEALVLNTGHLMAPAPPGATEKPETTPAPIEFSHHILLKKGWYTKYPLGWPFVLSLSERFGVGWITNPLLGLGILLCTFAIGRMIAGPLVGLMAVVLLALSPSFLSQCALLMPHPLAGLCITGSFWAGLAGLRHRRLSYFALMFLLIGLTFHVRPYTALLAGLTLTAAIAIYLRRDIPYLARLLGMGAVIGLLTIVSTLFYNRALTGNPWLSPYAFSRGTSVPVEISASLPQIVANLRTISRFSAQDELLYSFPLIFLLAGVGLWHNRKSFPMVLLLSFFIVIVGGHLIQVEPSASIAGERYWFEALFGIAILAAEGTVTLLRRFGPSKRSLAVLGCCMFAAQSAITAAAVSYMWNSDRANRTVAQLAAKYVNCQCVVFIKNSPPFYARNMNLNRPEWEHERVFYAVDPGSANERKAWTQTLGWDRAAVIYYDPVLGIARREK
jgi:hypothetical protein